MNSVFIVVTGSEVLDGRVLDTNSNWIATELSECGIAVSGILTCDDSLGEITSALRYAADRSRIVIVSGGMGPTADDLTREALAELSGAPLQSNDEAKEQLEAFYAARKRRFDETNLKQALIPAGGIVVKNRFGTAPGIRLRHERAEFIALPGVPSELRGMMTEEILPYLEEVFLVPERKPRPTLKIFGLPESSVGRLVRNVVHPSTLISYRAVFPEVHVVIRSTDLSTIPDDEVAKIRNAIGSEFIFSESPDDSLAAVVLRRLTEKDATVAVAESCTGGMIGSFLTNEGGSSRVFLGGVVCYSNQSKSRDLGVTPESIEQFGAVSETVVRQLAENVRRKFGSSYGIAISGIAGPDGGTPDKPVGTLWFGLSDEGRTRSLRVHFSGTRAAIRTYGTYVALDILRRVTCGLELREDLPHVPKTAS